MKTSQTTTWTSRIAFYLLSLVVLAMFGWSEGAIWLVAFFGGIALAVWGIAGLDGKDSLEADDLSFENFDTVFSDAGSINIKL